MAHESVALEFGTYSAPTAVRLKGISLRQRIFWGVTSILMGMGLLIAVANYYFSATLVRGQMDRLTWAIATNLGDAASGLVLGRKALELNVLVAKFARQTEVAYAYVQDAQGRILARSPSDVAPELRLAAMEGRNQTSPTYSTFRSRSVIETRIPMLEGRAGAAYVGMWQDAVEAETGRFMIGLISVVGMLIVGGIVLCMFVIRPTIRQIRELTAAAEIISKGNLEAAVEIRSHDEMGALAESLERMRVSLKAAMDRLGQNPSRST